MSQLSFHLFGSPNITRGGEPIHIERRRALALAIYLAVTDRDHSRDALSAFFWPEYDARRARTDLRRTLHVINQALGATWLVIEDDLVQFRHNGDLWLDIRRFGNLLAACEVHGHAPDALCPACLPLLSEAVALYQDDFLAGFSLPDSAAFDDWQFFESEGLRHQFGDALARLVQGYTAGGDYRQAITYARRWLTLDPINEVVHRWLMQLYTWHEQPTAALRQYDQCVHLLAEELDVPPEAATEDMYTAIKARNLPPPIVDSRFSVAPHDTPAIVAPLTATTADEIRVVTTLSLGLATTASWLTEPELEPFAATSQRLFNLVQSVTNVYGGRIQRLHGADQFIFFGAEQAHEDDAERAIRAALTIRQAAQAAGIAVAIGITTGMAHVQRVAETNGAVVTVTGPAVQLAPRLRNRSAVNQLLIDRNTYRSTRGIIRCTAGAITLPGIKATIPAYTVERLRRHAVKARGIEGLHADLVGRDAELAKLRTALAQALSHNGQIVAVVGEAGVGKSRLVTELKRWSAQQYEITESAAGTEVDRRVSDTENKSVTLLWLEGRGLEYTDTVSYSLFIDLFRGYWSVSAVDNEDALAENLWATLQTLQDEGHLAADMVEEIGPLLGHLLALRFGTAWDERLRHIDPSQLHQRTLVAAKALFVALAQQQPLVLVFEDLQWADALSLELVAALLDVPADLPILLLCLYRPEGTQHDERLATLARQHCPERFTEVRLRELTPTQSSALVASLLAIEKLPADVRDLILIKAQGNPLFLEEVVRGLIDSGQLYRVDSTWQAQGEITALMVPETLQRIVLSRVDRLPPAERQLLQQAAVLGRLFRPSVLATMGAVLPEIAPLLQLLTERAFIYLERALPEHEYSFHHILVRDAIYQELPLEYRALLHRQVAQALATHYAADLLPHVEVIAYHYLAGDDKTQALPYLLQAGEKARRAYLNQAASDYFQQAIQLLDTQPMSQERQAQRLTALMGLGQLFTVINEFDRAEAYLRQAILLSHAIKAPVTTQARLHAWLGDLLINWRRRPAEALDLVQAGLVLLGEAAESVEAAMLFGVMGWCYQMLGDENKFKAIGFHAASFVERLPPCEEFRPLYGLIHIVYLREKEVTTSRYWCRQAHATAKQLGDLRWLGEATSTIAHVSMVAGDSIDHFLSALQEGRRFLTQINERRRANWLTFEQEIYLLFYGLPGDAARMIAAITEARAVNPEHVGDMLGWLGMLYLTQGKPEKVRPLLAEMHEQHELYGFCPADAWVVLGYTELAADQPAAAIRAFEAALNAMGTPDFALIARNYEFRLRSFFANALCGLAQAYGDPARFRAFCDAFRADHAEQIRDTALTEWYLQPTDPLSTNDWTECAHTFHQSDADALPTNWQWIDPPGGASWCSQDGLILHCPNVRDLWSWYLTAPRLLHPIAGDWVVQTTCTPAYSDRPGIGGILLWQDKWHYLRLDWGEGGPASVALQGCVARREVVIGCGQLSGKAIYLRLEHTGTLIRALCSDDGDRWHLVGQVDFPTVDPVQVGLFAASNIDRFIYPGMYPDGTAIRFGSFQQWQRRPACSTDLI